MRQSRITLLVVLATLALAAGCDDGDGGGGERQGDYSACTDALAPNPNNQFVTCDSVMRGVEDYCGFSLTIDTCACAAEILDCITEGAWLQAILDCEKDASDCTSYIDCLTLVGPSPVEGCDSPNEWDCITTIGGTTDTDE